MIQQDVSEIQRLSSKNKLESCVYSFKKTILLLKNIKLEKLIRECENWLSDEGRSHLKEIYDAIINELEMLRMILESNYETSIVDRAIADFEAALGQLQSLELQKFYLAEKSVKMSDNRGSRVSKNGSSCEDQVCDEINIRFIY